MVRAFDIHTDQATCVATASTREETVDCRDRWERRDRQEQKQRSFQCQSRRGRQDECCNRRTERRQDRHDSRSLPNQRMTTSPRENATRLPEPRSMKSPRKKTAKFLRYVHQQQMWNKRQRPPAVPQQQQLSAAAVRASEDDAAQCVQQRTAEQIIDVPDDAGTSAQQRTVEHVVEVDDETTAVQPLDEEPLDETQRAERPGASWVCTSSRGHAREPSRAEKRLAQGRSKAPLQARQSALSERQTKGSLMLLCLRPRRPCAQRIGRTAGSTSRYLRALRHSPPSPTQCRVRWSNTLLQYLPYAQQQYQ